jgi:hypothetical protein
MELKLPNQGMGRPTAERKARYEAELEAFCELIMKINKTLDFRVSARGWCYQLEEYGLRKGDFDTAQSLISVCRKEGRLPLDIVADDEARSFAGIEDIDQADVDGYAKWVAGLIDSQPAHYHPFSFWNDKDVFIAATVEKIDLKNLFGPIFEEFHIPYANWRGWSNISSRGELMTMFAEHTAAGRQCVLLYCGDHDPLGLSISERIRDNMRSMVNATGWMPDGVSVDPVAMVDSVIIDRFGLNSDFIEEHGLTWIDNLETGSGGRLDNPKHRLHNSDVVQSYIATYGVRKVEANALVVRPEDGRELCRNAILKYLDPDSPELYRAALQPYQEAARVKAMETMRERFDGA